jgi:cell pole-organizing protein PopZ
MAQASSAQREPSMEEILASIRRIIEDSDTTRKQGDEPSVAGRVPEAAAFEAKPVTGSVVDVDAFRAELRSVPEAAVDARQAVPEVAPEKKPMTLAEVQAQISREAYSSPPETTAPAVENDEARAPLETADDFAGDLDIEDELQSEDGLEEAKFAQAETASEPEPEPAAAEASWTLPSPKPAIISEHAGRQVAAAFGELSEAFAATRKKSFDELAEEMMRPMLQDWLDNNLPVLVERLVREEIERVARGVR